MATIPEANEPPLVIELFTQGTVTIKVGQGDMTKIYTVHKALLVHYSGYSKGALGSENFLEGQVNEIVLSDVDPTTMVVFIDWLYNQKLPIPSIQTGDDWRPWKKRYNLSKAPGWYDLARICILADRFLVDDLKNQVLKALCFVRPLRPTRKEVELAYNNLPEDHPCLGTMAFYYALTCAGNPRESLDIKQMEQLPATFLGNVIIALAGRMSERQSLNFVSGDFRQESEE